MFLLNFQLGPQSADADDQILQDRHIRFGREIKLFFIRLRIRRQRDRFQRWLPIIDRLPDFFGDKRHDRMQESQRSFEQVHQIATGNAGGLFAGRAFGVQPALDQLDVPVAEIPPEEIVDAVRRFMKAVVA